MLVASHHAFAHLRVEYGGFLVAIFRIFPGVPIFFFVSGFLISRSYENSSVIREYAQNRVLRIYPALIACTFVSILSVFLTGYFANINLNGFRIMTWIVGQISVVQFYNPDFMRGFGTGVLNGSLWTITVELQFYILVPIIYNIFGFTSKSNNRQNSILVILILFFMAINIVHIKLEDEFEHLFLYKLWGLSFSPWIYMFLVGMFFQKNFNRIYSILQDKFPLILFIYLSIAYCTKNYSGWTGWNNICPQLFCLLTLVIFSFAYSFPKLSDNLLRKNDVSYGLYIYHIPVINIFLYYGYVSDIKFVLLSLALTIVAAAISWKSMLLN